MPECGINIDSSNVVHPESGDLFLNLTKGGVSMWPFSHTFTGNVVPLDNSINNTEVLTGNVTFEKCTLLQGATITHNDSVAPDFLTDPNTVILGEYVPGVDNILNIRCVDDINGVVHVSITTPSIEQVLVDTPFEFTAIDAFIATADGASIASSYYIATPDFLDVSGVDYVIYKSGMTTNSTQCAVAGYDDAGNFVQALLINHDTVANGPIQVDIPPGVTQIKACSDDGVELIIERPALTTGGAPVSTYPMAINRSIGVVGHSIWQSVDPITDPNVFTFLDELVQFEEVSNYSKAGHSLAQAASQVSILTYKDTWIARDIWVFDMTTNDFKLNVPIGTQNDFLNNTGRATYYGALRELHDTLFALNNSYIMFAANAMKRGVDGGAYSSFLPNPAGHTLTDYSDALEWVCDRLSWRFVNQFRESGISMDNMSTMTYDNLHPSEAGYKTCIMPLWYEVFKPLVGLPVLT